MQPNGSLHFDILRSVYPIVYGNRKLDGSSENILARIVRIGRIGGFGFFRIDLTGAVGEIERINVFLAGIPLRMHH